MTLDVDEFSKDNRQHIQQDDYSELDDWATVKNNYFIYKVSGEYYATRTNI